MDAPDSHPTSPSLQTGLAIGLLMLGLAAVFLFALDRPTPYSVDPSVPTPIPEPEGWVLVWHDEFDGPEIDPANWTYDLGGNGWGNNEWQGYTNRPENARIENGMLVIEAREELTGGRPYSSARLKTHGLQSWMYGRFEARLKVPYGQGIWPALWMMGDNIYQKSWPLAGEIDIMEHIGSEPAIVHGTIHGPGYSGGNGPTASYTLESGVFTDDFHTFAVEWDETEIRWYVDGLHYSTKTASELPGEWVFDHKFFILINLAVGGRWPGYPDKTTVFPQYYYVDYVRVFQREGMVGAAP